MTQSTHISTLEMSKEEWLKQRQQGIGSSDVGAILGLSPYKTPYEVWQEKVAAEPVEIPDNPAMEFGRRLEQVIADKYADDTKRKVVKDNKIRLHPDYPFLLCNLDRVILPSNGEGRGILECKTAAGYAAKGWEDEIPLTYYAQIQHQFAVTGLTWGEFALLIDGRNFSTFPVKRDDVYIARQNELLVKFWTENVLCRVAPPMTVEDYTIIKAQAGSIIEATPEIELAHAELFNLKKAFDEAKLAKEEKENEIKQFIGENEALVSQGKILATWKTVNKKEYVVKASSSRQFRLKGGKDNDNA